MRMSDFRGSPTVVTFLYTTCEDTCPSQAQVIKGAFAELGRDLPAVAVAVDPPRDTPARAQKFLDRAAHAQAGCASRWAAGTSCEPVWEGFAVQPQRETSSTPAGWCWWTPKGIQRVALPDRPGHPRASGARPAAPAAPSRWTSASTPRRPAFPAITGPSSACATSSRRIRVADEVGLERLRRRPAPPAALRCLGACGGAVGARRATERIRLTSARHRAELRRPHPRLPARSPRSTCSRGRAEVIAGRGSFARAVPAVRATTSTTTTSCSPTKLDPLAAVERCLPASPAPLDDGLPALAAGAAAGVDGGGRPAVGRARRALRPPARDRAHRRATRALRPLVGPLPPGAPPAGLDRASRRPSTRTRTSRTRKPAGRRLPRLRRDDDPHRPRARLAADDASAVRRPARRAARCLVGKPASRPSRRSSSSTSCSPPPLPRRRSPSVPPARPASCAPSSCSAPRSRRWCERARRRSLRYTCERDGQPGGAQHEVRTAC